MMTKAQPYQICTKLVMDTSDPEIRFDAYGVCNHYHEFQKFALPNWRPDGTGRQRLNQMVEALKAKGRGKEYDCLIGLSGGMDSSYMLHRMVKDYDIRPLVFHVDAGWNSEIAVSNINSLIDKLGLDLYTEVIDWNEVRDFQLSLFKSGTPYIDLAQDIAFIGVLFKFAEQFNIKTILNGGNISTEFVSYPQKYFYFADMAMVRDIIRQHGSFKYSKYPFTSALYRKITMPYVRGIKMIKPLNYVPYEKASASAELADAYGWKPYKQKHFESRLTRFFEGYWLPTRFGFDVRRVQFSSLILTGQMTRDEALEDLTKPAYDQALVERDFEYIATKLGISVDRLREYANAPLKYYFDYRNHSTFLGMGEKILSRLTATKRGGAL